MTFDPVELAVADSHISFTLLDPPCIVLLDGFSAVLLDWSFVMSLPHVLAIPLVGRVLSDGVADLLSLPGTFIVVLLILWVVVVVNGAVVFLCVSVGLEFCLLFGGDEIFWSSSSSSSSKSVVYNGRFLKDPFHDHIIFFMA